MDTTAFIADLRARKFTLRAASDALYVEPRVSLTAADVERIRREKAEILAILAAPLPTPSLLPDGSVRIGFDCAPKYQWWKPGSQSIPATLAELNAPAATVRRYTELAEDGLHTGSMRGCEGRVVELDTMMYCDSCGWREEVKADSLPEVLGF